MTIHEKLDRLTSLSNRSAISRAAGFHHGMLASTLKQKRMPSAPSIVALAKVLGVDAGWLFDDVKGWPPVRVDINATEDCHAA